MPILTRPIRFQSIAVISLLVAAWMLWAPAAFAIEVEVDPADYSGNWRVSGVTGSLAGPQTVTLAPGNNYEFKVGVIGGFIVNVAADGTITSTNEDAATAASSVLTFKTTSITVDPAAYTGLWRIQDVTSVASGPAAVTVVPALNYRIIPGVVGGFNFTVAADGSITSLNLDAATAIGSALTFNTTPITVDPGAYEGQWRFQNVNPATSGLATVNLVPAINWRILFGPTGGLNIAVAADGFVTSLRPESALGGPGIVTLGNVTITIDPGGYTGSVRLEGATGNLFGVSEVALVAHQPYRLVTALGTQDFFVSELCEVTPANFNLGGYAFEITCAPTNEAPIADAGADVEADCTEPGGATVMLDGTASYDPDGDALSFQWNVPEDPPGVPLVELDDTTSSTPSGLFPLGETLVTLTVTDPSGEIAVDDVLVSVTDTSDPVATCSTDLAALWPPNHAMVPVNVSVAASDACAVPELLDVQARISSNEPDDGNGDGSNTGDVDGEDAYIIPVDIDLSYNFVSESFEGTVLLRAERDGAQEGRVYSIVCDITDPSGNATTVSCVVVVPHDRRK